MFTVDVLVVDGERMFVDVLADDFSSHAPLFRAALVGYDMLDDVDDHMPFDTLDFGIFYIFLFC